MRRVDWFPMVAATCLAGAACSPRSGAYPVDVGWDAEASADLPDAGADAPGDLSGDWTSDVDARVPVPVRGACEPNAEPFPTRPQVDGAPTLRPLHVYGRDLVDDTGTKVALRGVNFGAWLQAETWVSGLGLITGDELAAQVPAMADAYGVGDLYDDAFATIAGEWALELRSYGPLIDDVRASMYANVTEEREGAVDAFWAWFDSVPWIFDEQSLWEWFGHRDGWDKAMEMREAFADTWITEADVQLVAAMGLNLVRVPVWYDALETDLAGGDNGFRPEGWRHLDDVARWARKHGVYVMIDLHGLPGGQSTSPHQGLRDGGHLFATPACKDKAARLWKAIASYFDGDPHVAVLDLVNEPMSVESATQYRDVHDAIYKAIRAVDVDASFIVMAEDGYKAGSMLASPKEMGWTNAMFSIHLYPDSTSTAGELAEAFATELRLADTRLGSADAKTYADRFDCPLFLGEFSPHVSVASETAAAVDGTLQVLNDHGVHWAPWTWKYRVTNDTWGVLHPPVETEQRLDITRPFDEVKADLAKLSTSTWVEYKAYADVLRARAKDPVRTLVLTTPVTP